MALTFDPIREFDRLTTGLFEITRGPKAMPIDLYKQGDSYVLAADIPGVDPASVDVNVDGQQLSIRAERTIGNAENAAWIARERSGGSYLRQITLGQGIDTERIAANYANGVLTVTLPVSEKAKPRRIAVGMAGTENAEISAS